MRLLIKLIAEAEETTAENIERARLTFPEMRGRDHSDVFYILRDWSDINALRARTVWLRRRGMA